MTHHTRVAVLVNELQVELNKKLPSMTAQQEDKSIDVTTRIEKLKARSAKYMDYTTTAKHMKRKTEIEKRWAAIAYYIEVQYPKSNIFKAVCPAFKYEKVPLYLKGLPAPQ